MTVTRIIAIIALLLAVLSVVFQGAPLLLVAVILLAVVEVIRG